MSTETYGRGVHWFMTPAPAATEAPSAPSLTPSSLTYGAAIWPDTPSKRFMNRLRDDVENDSYMAWAIESTTPRGFENLPAKIAAVAPPTDQNETAKLTRTQKVPLQKSFLLLFCLSAERLTMLRRRPP